MTHKQTKLFADVKRSKNERSPSSHKAKAISKYWKAVKGFAWKHGKTIQESRAAIKDMSKKSPKRWKSFIKYTSRMAINFEEGVKLEGSRFQLIKDFTPKPAKKPNARAKADKRIRHRNDKRKGRIIHRQHRRVYKRASDHKRKPRLFKRRWKRVYD